MNDPARLKAQMAELGVKFLERTRAETASIAGLIEKLAAGDAAAAQDLGYLVHRIHGGGATFGFDALSEQAGELEQLIDPVLREGAAVTPQTVQKLRELGQQLQDSARAAQAP